MKFKIGDTVKIRNLTDEERQTIPLFYHVDMIQYEEKTGKIVDVATNYYGYTVIEVEFQNETWWWLEEWLEPPVSYDAF